MISDGARERTGVLISKDSRSVLSARGLGIRLLAGLCAFKKFSSSDTISSLRDFACSIAPDSETQIIRLHKGFSEAVCWSYIVG